MIRLDLIGGAARKHAGGASGPPLPPGHLLDLNPGGSDVGPRVLVARAAPAVHRLELPTENGEAMNVPLRDCAEIPEVRFAAILPPPDLPLASVAWHDRDDGELERFDLRFHQSQWEMRHLPPGRAHSPI